MTDVAKILNDYTKVLKERNTLQVRLDQALERLAAAEAVCQLLEKSYLVLPGGLERALLRHWKSIKDKTDNVEEVKP